MRAFVVVLAVVGVVAILRALARTLLRLGLRAAEETTAAGMAEVSARRGDLTGLTERREAAREARRLRRIDLALVVGWVAWLVLPPFVGWTAQAYAMASPLWLVAPPRLRLGGGSRRRGSDSR